MKIWKQLWFCNSFLAASKPRWFLIGWQREQEVFFWGVSVWLLLLNCCCERLAAWCGDGTVWEQVTQRSHQPCTQGDIGGAWCVFVGWAYERQLKTKKVKTYKGTILSSDNSSLMYCNAAQAHYQHSTLDLGKGTWAKTTTTTNLTYNL